MRIQLPSGERIILDTDKTLEEKVSKVKELTETWSKEILSNWDSDSIRFFLDNLGSYLVWHKEKEERNMEDKEVLSIRKSKEIDGKQKSKSIPFTSLSDTQRESIGLEVIVNGE